MNPQERRTIHRHTRLEARATTATNEEKDSIETAKSIAYVGAHLTFGALSQRRLNPAKLVYDPDWPDGLLNFNSQRL